MYEVPPPEKPHVIYVVPQTSPAPVSTPTPKAKRNGDKTVDEFIRDMERGSRAAPPQQPMRVPTAPAPIFRDNMPRFGDDEFVPVQAPVGDPMPGGVDDTLRAMLGFGLFLALLYSALSAMFVGFFMYLGAMLARRLLRAISGQAHDDAYYRVLAQESRARHNDVAQIALAAAAADAATNRQ